MENSAHNWGKYGAHSTEHNHNHNHNHLVIVSLASLSIACVPWYLADARRTGISQQLPFIAICVWVCQCCHRTNDSLNLSSFAADIPSVIVTCENFVFFFCSVSVAASLPFDIVIVSVYNNRKNGNDGPLFRLLIVRSLSGFYLSSLSLASAVAELGVAMSERMELNNRQFPWYTPTHKTCSIIALDSIAMFVPPKSKKKKCKIIESEELLLQQRSDANKLLGPVAVPDFSNNLLFHFTFCLRFYSTS